MWDQLKSNKGKKDDKVLLQDVDVLDAGRFLLVLFSWNVRLGAAYLTPNVPSMA